MNKSLIFALPSASEEAGIVAQLVEQRTENPCVGGSIPSDTTTKGHQNDGLFYCKGFCNQPCLGVLSIPLHVLILYI